MIFRYSKTFLFSAFSYIRVLFVLFSFSLNTFPFPFFFIANTNQVYFEFLPRFPPRYRAAVFGSSEVWRRPYLAAARRGVSCRAQGRGADSGEGAAGKEMAEEIKERNRGGRERG